MMPMMAAAQAAQFSAPLSLAGPGAASLLPTQVGGSPFDVVWL